jgi:hypothetical protein
VSRPIYSGQIRLHGVIFTLEAHLLHRSIFIHRIHHGTHVHTITFHQQYESHAHYLHIILYLRLRHGFVMVLFDYGLGGFPYLLPSFSIGATVSISAEVLRAKHEFLTLAQSFDRLSTRNESDSIPERSPDLRAR